jgi:hypothetical protein
MAGITWRQAAREDGGSVEGDGVLYPDELIPMEVLEPDHLHL